ncbi:MAG TPA: DUF4126 domain-containing protein [Flavisolibacter sp.]|nr:DUF4126 domain-containing protein [Flavisolibacter sp.]
MDYSLVTNIALGIALSACAGFRVFIPMLAGAVAGHINLMALPADMVWLQSWPAIICFGVAAIVEIGAYYIPFVDNLLDTIATPLSVVAGTVLAASILPVTDMEPPLRWGIGLLAGGSAAGTIQLGTGLLRLLSSKTTVGTGNAVVATTENAAAVSGSVLAFIIPVFIAVLVLFLIGWLVIKFGRKIFRRGKRTD